MPELAEQILASNADQPGTVKSNAMVSATACVAQCFKLAPPPGATSVKFTSGVFRPKKSAGAGSTPWNVFVGACDAAHKPHAGSAEPWSIAYPQTYALAQVPVSDIPTAYADVPFTFANTKDVPLVEGQETWVALVVVVPQFSPSGNVECAAGGTQDPPDMLFVGGTANGLTWQSPQTGKDFNGLVVNGKYTTP